MAANCGIGDGNDGVCIGHVCILVTRAAKGICDLKYVEKFKENQK